MFQAIITRELKVPEKSASTPAAITYEEANALRYVAGFVCSKIQKRITASKHPHRDQMLLCMMDLCNEEEEELETDSAASTTDWVNAIDRGGLVFLTPHTCFSRRWSL